jgi:hypothetical protein
LGERFRVRASRACCRVKLASPNWQLVGLIESD